MLKIFQTSVTGLKGVEYLDAVDSFARKMERDDAIKFIAETDRVYFNTPHTTEIRDAALRRVIRVEKPSAFSLRLRSTAMLSFWFRCSPTHWPSL